MTPFEQWLTEQVRVLVGDEKDKPEPDWAMLERRAAILITQARALENRHLQGELIMNEMPQVKGCMIRPEIVLQTVANKCFTRSQKLETLARLFCEPEHWPPQEAPRVEVVRQ